MSLSLETKEYNSILAILAMMLTGADAILIMGLQPLVVTTYVEYKEINESLAGYAIATELIGITSGNLFISFRLHILNRRKYAFAGLLLVLLGNLSTTAVNNYSTLLLVRFLTGIGSGIAAAVMAGSLAATAYPDKNFGIYTILVLILTAISTLSVGHLLGNFGGSEIFYFLAIMTLPGMCLNIFFPIRAPTLDDRSIATQRNNRELVNFSTFAVASSTLLYYIAAGAIWSYIGLVGRDAAFSTVLISKLLAFAHLAGAAGALTATIFGTRRGRARPIGFALICSTFCQIFWLVGYNNLITYALALQFFIFMWLLFFPYLMGFTAQLDRYGRISGLIFMLGGIGQAIGPALAGILIQYGSFSSIFYLGLICYPMTFIFLLPIVIKQESQVNLYDTNSVSVS